MDDTSRRESATIDALVDRYSARMPTRDIRSAEVLRRAVTEAYRAGRNEAWNGIQPTATVAKKLGLTTGRVRQLARKHGIGERFGHEWMFRDEDVAALEALPDRRKPKPE